MSETGIERVKTSIKRSAIRETTVGARAQQRMNKDTDAKDQCRANVN